MKPDILRLSAFLSVFVVMAIAEKIWPRRELRAPKGERWFINLAIVIMNTLMLRFMLPIAPIAMAALAQANGWGLFNLLKLTGVPEIVSSIILLDFIIYLQHRLFHRVSFLWRLHRMHHTDLDLDVSSGTRFHPFEMILSIMIKFAAIILLGASPIAVLLFEIMLNATSMFNHTNVAIPEKVDRWLRLILVTPDMHRVHHSIIPKETDSNFSFSLPWWDRLFGTYREKPQDGHEQMTIGLKEFRNLDELKFMRLMLIPFLGMEGRHEESKPNHP